MKKNGRNKSIDLRLRERKKERKRERERASTHAVTNPQIHKTKKTFLFLSSQNANHRKSQIETTRQNRNKNANVHQTRYTHKSLIHDTRIITSNRIASHSHHITSYHITSLLITSRSHPLIQIARFHRTAPPLIPTQSHTHKSQTHTHKTRRTPTNTHRTHTYTTHTNPPQSQNTHTKLHALIRLSDMRCGFIDLTRRDVWACGVWRCGEGGEMRCAVL